MSVTHRTNAACLFPGCDKPIRHRKPGLCEAHYRQKLRNGKLLPLASRRWTESEIAFVREWYKSRTLGKLDLAMIAAKLNRTKNLICRKAREIGLTDAHRTWRKSRRKYQTDEEVSDARSRNVKRYIALNGHPRGMLGKQHTPKARALIAAKTREMNAGRSRKDWRKMGRKATAKKIELYGTAGPPPGSNQYSRTKGGKRSDLGNIYFRSSWEANYARYLNFLVSQGKIKCWRYEPTTFWFKKIKRGVVTYKPDFEVTENDGRIVFHEVKGWDYPRGKTARKRMAKYYPQVTLVLIDERQYRAIAKWKAIIPGWE